jgi:hypothetical protein
LRSLVVKHLTGNQVLGDRIYSRLEPADEALLAYISCYISKVKIYIGVAWPRPGGSLAPAGWRHYPAVEATS